MEMPLWDQKDSEEISAALISFLINDVLFKKFIILYFENEQSSKSTMCMVGIADGLLQIY